MTDLGSTGYTRKTSTPSIRLPRLKVHSYQQPAHWHGQLQTSHKPHESASGQSVDVMSFKESSSEVDSKLINQTSTMTDITPKHDLLNRILLTGLLATASPIFGPNRTVAQDAPNTPVPATPVSSNQASLSLSRNAAWPVIKDDWVYDLEISGDRAYLARGITGLAVWDVSDLENTIELSRHDTGGLARLAHLQGTTLVIANGVFEGAPPPEIRLSIFDLSEDRPILTDVTYLPGIVTGMTGLGSTVFATSSSGRAKYLTRIDLSDPTHPVLTDISEFGDVSAMTISGNRGYIGADSILHIIDLSESGEIQRLGKFEQPGNDFWMMSSQGNHIYTNTQGVGAGGIGQQLQALDASIPSSVTVLWEQAVTGFFGLASFEVSGKRIAASGGAGQLHIFDITDPTVRPQRTSTGFTVNRGVSLEFGDESLWVAEPFRGLTWFDLSDATAADEKGNFGLETVVRKAVRVEDLVYSIDDFLGLAIHKLQASGEPKLIGHHQDRSFYTDFAVRGDDAFAVSSKSRFESFDLSHPESPALRASARLGVTWSEGFDIVGDYAYVVAGDDGLVIVDITDPANPNKVSQLPSLSSQSEWLAAVKVRDGIAYIANGEGLLVVDVSNPLAPQRLASYGLEGRADVVDIDLWGNVVVLASNSPASGTGLTLVDVSNPERPQRFDRITAHGAVEAVSVFENLIAIVTRDGSLVVIDAETSQTIAAEKFGINNTGTRQRRAVFQANGRAVVRPFMRSGVVFDENGIIVTHPSYGMMHFELLEGIRIERIALDENQVPELILSGISQSQVEILGSENLIDWRVLGIHDPSAGNVFRDEPAKPFSARYYRLRSSNQ